MSAASQTTVDLVAAGEVGRMTLVAPGLRVEADLSTEQVAELARDCLAVLEAHDEPAPETDLDDDADDSEADLDSPPAEAEDVEPESEPEALPVTVPSPKAVAALARASLPAPEPPRGPVPIFSGSVIRFMERRDIDPSAITEGFLAGGDEWISPNQNGESTAYIRVVSDEYAVAYFPPRLEEGERPFIVSVLALERAYEERRRAGHRREGRTSAGSAARSRPRPTDVPQLVQLLTGRGFTIARANNNHLRVSHPERPGAAPMTLPSTPSDHRSVANTLSALRRQFPGLLE